MSLVNITALPRTNQPMPVYSGTSGRLDLVLNVTVDDPRVIFTGLQTANFDITLWNPSGQALTVDNNLSNFFVSETKERPGVYFLTLDWLATTSRNKYGDIVLQWVGFYGGTYVAAVRVHENVTTYLGQTIVTFQAAFAEPLGE